MSRKVLFATLCVLALPLMSFAQTCPSSPPTCPSGQVLYYVPDGGPCVNAQMKCKPAPSSVPKPVPTPTQPTAPAKSTVAKPVAPSTTTVSGLRTLIKGMRGTDVTTLQLF